MKEKIYLIPGLMTDVRLWSRIKPFLAEYELVHVAIPDSSDFDEVLDLLEDTFKEEKVNLLGFSLGGYIASYFAVTYPSRVNKLFMIAATPGASEVAEIERRREKFAVIEKEGFKGLSYEKAVSLVEKQNQEDIELITIIQDMFMDLGKETFISQLTSTFNRVDLLEELVRLNREFNLPIWFYYSDSDRLLNHKSIAKLKTTNHNIKLISRKGTSHNVPLEVPFELSLEIKEWMK
mgnify:CR=1 FL=1